MKEPQKMLKAADFDEALLAFREEDLDASLAPFAREQGEILEFITELGGELSEEDEVYLELTALNAWRLIKAAGFTAPPATRETMQALQLARLKRMEELLRNRRRISAETGLLWAERTRRTPTPRPSGRSGRRPPAPLCG